MKKIMLCGALQCEIENFGDVLLREILINNLHKYDNTLEIVDYNSKTTLKEMKECDYFIYIPGGYLGYIESWYSGSIDKTIQRVIHYYWPGIKAALLRKKIILLAQGIGPYEYPVLGNMLGFIANRAMLITVRDQKGKDLLRRVGVRKKIYVTADTAQTLTQHDLIHECEESQKIKDLYAGKTIIFVHSIGVDEYRNKIYKALKDLFFEREDICFVIGHDGGGNYGSAKQWANKFPKNRCMTYRYKGVSQLITIINSVDCVITGKFHVGIVGCTLSKSVLNFSVQYAKASLYYEQIGYPERCKDLFNVSEADIRNSIEELYLERVRIPTRVLEKANSNYDVFLQKVMKS